MILHLFGELSLVTALCFACVQGSLPFLGYARKNPYLLAFARVSAYGQAFFVFAAYGLLTTAFGLNEANLAYVAANSHPDLPLVYRLTAVWGAHEGSMLLWIVLLNAWTIAVIINNQETLAVAFLGLISAAFLMFLIFTSNPFTLAASNSSMQDLNPLLQDPGFIIHPPLLYIGYVGFASVFAFTLAALLRGELNASWAKRTRHFALAAWCFLTLGITLGSWWAYRVLGWGGFWFWDPVENASLLPWLAGTAFIHVALLVEKRGTCTAWAAMLAIMTFALSLLGTFLVRSGALISAHTFASDPERGVFLLLLLAALLALSLYLYLNRIHTAPRITASFTVFSRETYILLNSALLFIMLATILLGTLYPLIIEALQLGSISVGAPYFNIVLTPFVFLMLLGIGCANLSKWHNQPARSLIKQAARYLLISFLITFLLEWLAIQSIHYLALFGITCSLFAILTALHARHQTIGMALAHTGAAVLIIGILLSSLFSQEKNVRVKPGDIVSIGAYQFLFVQDSSLIGSNFRGIQATFDVMKGTQHIATLYPEKRIYTVREMVMTEVAIHPGIFRDLYIALGEPLNETDWSVRIYYKPFMRWVWAGGILMFIGGFCMLIKKKHPTPSY